MPCSDIYMLMPFHSSKTTRALCSREVIIHWSLDNDESNSPVSSFPIFSLPDPTLIRPTGLILHTTYLILAETERGWFAMK